MPNAASGTCTSLTVCTLRRNCQQSPFTLTFDLKLSANDLHMVQLMPEPTIISYFIKIENGSAFLVLAYPGCLGKEAVKWVLLLLSLYTDIHFFLKNYCHTKSVDNSAIDVGLGGSICVSTASACSGA